MFNTKEIINEIMVKTVGEALYRCQNDFIWTIGDKKKIKNC